MRKSRMSGSARGRPSNGLVYSPPKRRKVQRLSLTGTGGNPFEKFERKRFVYYSKDLNMLSFHPALWEQLTAEKKEEIREKEAGFLQAYYEKLGGM